MGNIKVEKISDFKYRIRKHGDMNVDGIVYSDSSMMEQISKDESLTQVANVATLPGIVKHSLAMPDIHWGYGFPIGGVAAFRLDDGIVSPGGVGYDINCGVRLLRSFITRDEIKPHIKSLTSRLFMNIPSGVGSKRKDMRLNNNEARQVLIKGASWAVKKGFGTNSDIEHIEDRGTIEGADPDRVSDRAIDRGRGQLGTLGSGNHFVEIGYVEEIYDEVIASRLGLEKDIVTVFIHSGSRGLGHQVCDDYIKVMLKASNKYGIRLPDKQLCCAPVNSDEGQQYLGAMAGAANYAFANRQMMTHWARESFEQELGKGWEKLGLSLVYDVAHNIAKIETHEVDGKKMRLCVHRKGATRAFPPGHPDIPADYRDIGQPVLIPGDMGRYSYVLVGTHASSEQTFGSTCHGAGRLMSRHKAKKIAKGRDIARELEDAGIYVRSTGRSTLMEEIPEAYKDVADVVDVVHGAGIGKKVVRLKPLAVIKG